MLTRPFDPYRHGNQDEYYEDDFIFNDPAQQSKPMTLAEEKEALKRKIKADFKKKKPVKYKKATKDILNDPKGK